MACCGGSCSCGKGNKTPEEENLRLVQLPTNQGMLSSFDWMAGMKGMSVQEEVAELRFKNNRKAFYRNSGNLSLKQDDQVVVQAEGGHDLGMVCLAGALAEKQFEQKASATSEKAKLPRIYRPATQVDLDNWLKAKGREREVLMKARQMASSLGLDMSLSDVEFRGDGRKATFFYTADGRVDFRELVRSYASTFRIRVEMRQIGVRQEAAKVGGIGSCGRELCCSTWKTDMNSVKTDAARTQNLSLTTSKLAGQCGKLKCCLNYELETYLEAWEQFPAELIQLDSDRGLLKPLYPDILKGTVHYSLSEGNDLKRFEIPVDKVKLYISLNKKGKRIATDRIVSIKTPGKEPQVLFN